MQRNLITGTKLIARQTEIFQGMFDTYIPSSLAAELGCGGGGTHTHLAPDFRKSPDFLDNFRTFKEIWGKFLKLY